MVEHLQTHIPLLGKIFERLAPKIGAVVNLEPTWKTAGQIVFANGRKRYFRYSSIDLNPLGASEIAKDKDYARYFMASLGYRAAPGQTFFHPEWAQMFAPDRGPQFGWDCALEMGLPVIVKPNTGSQGRGVACVSSRRQFDDSVVEIFKIDRVAIVQPKLDGNDYRVVVLDSEVISAYQRVPLNVTGDGVSSIRDLMRVKQAGFVSIGRDARIDPDDTRTAAKLGRQDMSLETVLPKGHVVHLLDNANLSCGGDAIDVTDRVSADFQRLCIQLAKDMGLRLCGVDLIVSGTLMDPSPDYAILEINAAPGLDHYYAMTGERQRQIVEDLYLKVLRSMATTGD
jgi:D-alanine-D-alanine ligase-like ATP-grasp enzyme